MKIFTPVFPTYPIRRNPIPYPKYPIPVLVLACNRIGVKRSLDAIIKYRPSSTLFPLIVSQDCDDEPTKKIILSYEGVVYLKQPNQTEYNLPAKKKKLQGYFRLSRHYKWALNQVFIKFNYNSCIIVEDDLEISPDFFEYLIATKPLLEKDPTLYCVSAWNDNGVKAATNVKRYDLILRTDFFPGLGWLMLKPLWLELEPKWPEAFWDDWLRSPEIRMGRSCLRPEVSRVFNFGEQGVSRGLHYKTHLVHIVKNEKFVNFRRYDLKSLMFDSFSESLLRTAYSSALTTSDKLEGDISKKPNIKSFRIKYTNKDNFKTLAKKLSIMADTLVCIHLSVRFFYLPACFFISLSVEFSVCLSYFALFVFLFVFLFV
ncbi:hypothetical protein HELRODRAFT_72024 [Helobdella robusta]|uniref:Alpha-1,3-mannosyl-glycoprotein 2-beta-N-acetylglucosaminyltransferase n=1 Tax=Helobdella robusta TaxID=6412 RepID=T1G0U2_HELRO|nr:hypothetical protein HELRODRAFT_72024 [Helobdella robusta]ESO10940.1 hypothetical protein HELRODRAFT_72024 [Helobdella robusta]